MACFGGAGGQHACAIARSLGMNTVYVHKYAGILSAYGMALADVIHEEQAPCVLKYSEVNKDFFLFLASFMNISYYGQCTYFHVGTSGKITKPLSMGF